jgi:hypothetical protein
LFLCTVLPLDNGSVGPKHVNASTFVR